VPTYSRNVMLLAWTGPIGILAVLVGWMVLAGFLPPPSPQLSTQQVAELWSDHTNLKRLGMVICIWGGTLYVPFTIAIAMVMNGGRNGDRVLAFAQGALGTFGTVFFTLNFLILAVVAFRSPGSGEIIQPLHDLGFIMTFSPVAPFVFQYFAIGLFALQNRPGEPIFPRWVGYANIWVGIGLIPACLIPFFKTGPLAWNGLLSFWIPVAVFVAWFGVMFWVVRNCVRRDSATSS
jgi:hypothetical protein